MNTVPGWMWDSELRTIDQLSSKLAATVPILEVGSFLGRSAVQWAANHPQGQVVCVDPWIGKPEDYINLYWIERCDGDFGKVVLNQSSYAQFLNNTKDYKNILPVRLKSEEFHWYLDEPPGLIFIDAGHSYEEVMKDLELSYSQWKATPDTIICGHDYNLDPVRTAAHDFANKTLRKVTCDADSRLWIMST